VTVKQYNEISKISDIEFIDYNLHLIAILLRCDISILKDNLDDTDGIVKLVNSVSWLNSKIPIKESSILSFGADDYEPFNKFSLITFGDWISIETLMQSYPAINSILTILYKDTSGEHTGKIELFSEHINNEYITDHHKLYSGFVKYRNNVYKMYSGYFKMQKDEDDLQDEVDKRAGLYKSFDTEKYLWLMMVDRLVKELNLTPTKVYDLNLLDALNWLGYYNQKDQYENSQKQKR